MLTFDLQIFNFHETFPHNFITDWCMDWLIVCLTVRLTDQVRRCWSWWGRTWSSWRGTWMMRSGRRNSSPRSTRSWGAPSKRTRARRRSSTGTCVTTARGAAVSTQPPQGLKIWSSLYTVIIEIYHEIFRQYFECCLFWCVLYTFTFHCCLFGFSRYVWKKKRMPLMFLHILSYLLY